MKYITSVGKQQYTIDINKENEIVLDGEIVNADMQQMPGTLMYSIIIDGKSHDVRLSEGEGVYVVQVGGKIYEVVVEDERTRRLAGLKGNVALTGEAILKAPMPGVVVEVPVTVGQEVAQGDIVLVLESMKMQNEFKAPRAGTVHMVYVAAGDKVEQNDTMITIS
ncbi:MAG: biotin/lipoyl-binding protein [Anaerolineaceae bacterium]|nr:biotin/lipoyl-binding protein [Anaerolineaceae bacterium]MCB9098759.1 biotin/lipoyl-binding protein [Anaerolineales bacterium]